MNAFKMTTLAALFFGPLMAVASGPNILSSFQVQNQANGYVKACITTDAGWGESKLICSAATSRNNRALNDILRMSLAPRSMEVDSFQEGFAIEALLESLTVLNCATNANAESVIQQKKAQILKLQREIRAIEQNAAQRTCE